MNLKDIKNKYEDVKFAITIPYGQDKTWDKLSDDNFIKFLDIFQIVLYILIFSTPVASISVLSYQFIKNNL
jgi:hypothetical protein